MKSKHFKVVSRSVAIDHVARGHTPTGIFTWIQGFVGRIRQLVGRIRDFAHVILQLSTIILHFATIIQHFTKSAQFKVCDCYRLCGLWYPARHFHVNSRIRGVNSITHGSNSRLRAINSTTHHHNSTLHANNSTLHEIRTIIQNDPFIYSKILSSYVLSTNSWGCTLFFLRSKM